MALFIVLAAVPTLALSVTVLFTVLVIGIRKGDRHNLANAPRSGSDSLARRLFTGIRCSGNTAGEDQ